MCLIKGFISRIFLCRRSRGCLIHSFALMQKNQKIKAVMPSAKNGLCSAKMQKLATLKQFAFLNAARCPFS